MSGREAPGSVPPLTAALAARQPATAFLDRRCRAGACPGKDAYRMIGGCSNCRTEPILGLFTAGHEAMGGDCPVCGCNRLHWDRLATPGEIPDSFEAAARGES